MSDIETATRQLLAARMARQPLDALPPGTTPRSLEEVYALQDAQMRALGPAAGWKVGARSPTAEPNCAPLPASGVVTSPRRFESGQFPLRLVEAEVAYRIGRDLPPRAAPYTTEEVVAAVSSTHATIELLASRFVDFRAIDALAALADFLNHGALIVGEGVEGAVHLDATDLRVQLYVDDALDFETVGGNVGADLARLLGWLANHAAARTGGLRAGDIVTTGTCIGARPVPPDTKVKAVVGSLPPVEVEL